jgi:site-specific recombinase XerD
VTQPQQMRLAEARVTFLDRKRQEGLANSTLRDYNGILGRLVRDLGDIQCRHITPDHVEEWLYSRTDEHRTRQHGKTLIPGVSPSTFNQNLYTLRSFFKYCQKKGYLRLDPVGDVKAMRVPKKIRQRPPVDALLRMLETPTDPRDRAYLAMALNTAMRSSEIRTLRVGDAHLAEGYLDVVIHKTDDVDEKPISEELDRELRRWLVAYAENIGRPLERDDFLFPSNERSKMVTRGAAGRIVQAPKVYAPQQMIGRTEGIIQEALAAVGLPTFREGTHTLRRAVARAYYDAICRENGDAQALRDTQALLGHEFSTTTEGYLGMTVEKARRDKRIKGKPFLTAMVSQDNVVPLLAVGHV